MGQRPPSISQFAVKLRVDGTDWNERRSRRWKAGGQRMSARDTGDEQISGWWVVLFLVLALGALGLILVVLGGT